MTNKKTHLDFIESKGLFNIDCNRAIFSADEIEMLEKWGHWFSALTAGDLEPLNEDQDHFVRVSRMETQPVTDFEFAWFKYTNRKRIEAKDPDRFENKDFKPKVDPFYSREQAKIMKRRQFADMAKHHRE